MSRDRTDEDDPLGDAPDWFDAGVTEEVVTASGTDEDDRLDDEVGDWFTDPDHQPVGPGVASAEATVDDPATPGTAEDDEEYRTIVDEIAGTTGSADASPSVDDERSETPDPEFDSSPDEPMPDPSGVNTADEVGTATDATDATARPASEERGTGTAKRARRDDAEGTGSPVQRLVAWLRSVFGR